MTVHGVAITKSCSFRGVQQEFTNVYYYNGVGLTNATATTLANQVKALEVPFHSLDVTFVRYKVWNNSAIPSQNNMIAQGNLSGTGNQVVLTTMDRERAVLIRWPAGFDSRGHPVFLRKWYHSCGQFSGVGFTNPQLQNTAGLTTTERNSIAGAADNVRSEVVGPDTYDLSGPFGRANTGPAQCHQYLEHHQLGDMWR